MEDACIAALYAARRRVNVRLRTDFRRRLGTEVTSSEDCDPGNSNQGNRRSNNELGSVTGNPGRKGGQQKSNRTYTAPKKRTRDSFFFCALPDTAAQPV
jgi:hypothetical protein